MDHTQYKLNLVEDSTSLFGNIMFYNLGHFDLTLGSYHHISIIWKLDAKPRQKYKLEIQLTTWILDH